MKSLAAIGLAVGLTIAGNMASYADQWVNDSNGWWYEYDDGSYPTNCWKWIPIEFTTGTAYCYYFGEDGYILTNTTTPDGYEVNFEGLWTVDGVVQKKILSEEEMQKYRDDFERAKKEAKEAAIEEAKELLYDAAGGSFSEKKQAVFDYLEALGFSTSGLTISKSDGIRYYSGFMSGGSQSSIYNMLVYNSQNALNKMASYMGSGSYSSYDAADALIEAVEDYLYR